jgi:hypothetical protein
MINTSSDIAGAPGIASYHLVNSQINSSARDAADAANFQHILDKLAAQAQQAKSSTQTQATNFAMTKASGWTSNASSAATATADSSTSASIASASSNTHSFKSFMKNLWDVVNPLQHIPVVSAIYRHATGDTISDGAHFAGDALYGGVIGGAISMADIAFKKTTGNDAGETVIASLTGKGHSPSPSDTMVAQNNLPQITPASGGQATTPAATASIQAVAGKQIIWSNTASSSFNNSSSSSAGTSTSPLFPPSGTIGGGSANPSIPAQPTLQANSAASTGTIQTQEAPAGTARKAVSPELIASRMMDGLQKYTQMQQQDMNPQLSGLY